MSYILAVNLNNKGAQLIEMGHYVEATSLLAQSLKLVRSGDDSGEMNEQPRDVLPLNEQDPPATQVDPDGQFVFRTPITITDGTSGTTALYSSIIFNLGVAQHSQAIEEGYNEPRMHGALKIYELVFTLQENCRDEFELSFVHRLGLVNNCGQIYKHLNMENKANRLFQQLLATLMVVIEQGDEKIVSDMEGFIATTSHLILKSPPVARAA